MVNKRVTRSRVCLHKRYYWFKYDLEQKYLYALPIQSNQAVTVHFFVTEMPALTIRLSVTSPQKR